VREKQRVLPQSAANRSQRASGEEATGHSRRFEQIQATRVQKQKADRRPNHKKCVCRSSRGRGTPTIRTFWAECEVDLRNVAFDCFLLAPERAIPLCSSQSTNPSSKQLRFFARSHDACPPRLADCDLRKEGESTSKSDPGTTTPSIPAKTSLRCTPTPAAKTCPASTGGAPQYTEGFDEKIHWGPILKQSLGFLVFEHAFRLANDRYARHFLWHKPFWEDYFDSLQHFEMTRWGDGDDFLVNYIGHPLQGSVTGDIFIQNDPHGRSERFGKSGAYWKSRFRAMLYAAAYSTYFEIGPVLSETALGNEGGYVYVPKCGLAPCSIPGRHLKPPTNNTGWVDFVITPTVGMGWIVMEDAIEARMVDPLAGDSQSLTWKIVRGSLAPSRTMANFLQGKLPWYRPWLYENATGRAGNLIVPSIKPKDPSEASLWRDQPRKKIGIHYVNLSLPMDWQGCYKCRVNNSGVGAMISYRMTNHFWFDSEVNQFPGSGSSKGSGSTTEGLFGIRYGYTGRVWNVYVKARPGFIYYPKTTSFPTGHEFASLSRFALDCGGIIEMNASKRSSFRFDAGTTFVRYLQGLDPRQAPVAYISPTYIATQGNFQVATGYVFRF